MLQAVTRDRQIGAVGPDQRDIGAVKRRNYGHITLLLDRFAGEDRADRVRYRVMDVQQVELFGPGDRRHLGRESEVVWLMLKQRIRHHFHLVKMNPLAQLGQPRRQKRRDKMDVVAAFGQVAAELRADDAAAAVCWINCDADIHKSTQTKRISYHAGLFNKKLNERPKNRSDEYQHDRKARL